MPVTRQRSFFPMPPTLSKTAWVAGRGEIITLLAMYFRSVVSVTDVGSSVEIKRVESAWESKYPVKKTWRLICNLPYGDLVTLRAGSWYRLLWEFIIFCTSATSTTGSRYLVFSTT